MAISPTLVQCPRLPLVPGPAVGRAAPRELIRGLGLWTTTAIVVGTMIGTGIFLKPAEVAREAGSFQWSILAWVVGGGLSLFGALTYAELGAAIPDAGADFTYLRRGLGPAWGFLYAWKQFAVSHPAAVASYGSAMALFGSYLWPGLTAPLVRLGSFEIQIGQVLAVAVILGVTMVNFLSVRAVGRFQVCLTVLKVLSVAAVIAVGLSGLAGGLPVATEAARAGAGTPWRLSGFLAAVTATLWAYSGWNGVLRMGSEVKDPSRNLPRAMLGGFAFTALLFLLLNLACFAVLSFSQVAGSSHVVSDMLGRVAGSTTARWLTVVMIVSTLGSLNASTLGAARVPYAVARDGYFPRALAWLTPETRAPAVSASVPALVAVVLVLTGSFEDVTSLFVFVSWGFYALGAVALFRLRKIEPNLVRPVKAWGYPVVPAIFGLLAAVITLSLFVKTPVRSAAGLALVLVGMVFYRWTPALARGGSTR